MTTPRPPTRTSRPRPPTSTRAPLWAIGEPIETLDCPGCSNPERVEGCPEVQRHHGEAARPSAVEDVAGAQSLEINVDLEFSMLVPPLSREERTLLEHHLLTEGCRDPILVWDDGEHRILLDGHNRFEICRRIGLQYSVQTIELQGREAALLWILENQLGRRNLTPEAQAYLLGKLYNTNKRQGARSDLTFGHKDQKLTTADQLGADHHVSEKTIRRHAQFAQQLDQLAEAVGPDIKHAVLAREAKVSRTDVARLLKLEAPTRGRVIAQIQQGEAAAPLINEALKAAGASGPPLPTAPGVAAEEDSGRSAIRAEAQTGAAVTQAGAEETLPVAAPHSFDPARNDIAVVVEQNVVATVIWALAMAAQALERAVLGEIRSDLLPSIRERF